MRTRVARRRTQNGRRIEQHPELQASRVARWGRAHATSARSRKMNIAVEFGCRRKVQLCICVVECGACWSRRDRARKTTSRTCRLIWCAVLHARTRTMTPENTNTHTHTNTQQPHISNIYITLLACPPSRWLDGEAPFNSKERVRWHVRTRKRCVVECAPRQTPPFSTAMCIFMYT